MAPNPFTRSAGAAAPRFKPDYETFGDIIAALRNGKITEAEAKAQVSNIVKQQMENIPYTVGTGRAAQTFNIAPNAPMRVVEMPSGKVIEIPKDAAIPQGAKVLNKSADELYGTVPQEVKIAPPSRELNVGLPIVSGAVVPAAIAALGAQRGDIYGFDASRRAADERARLEAEDQQRQMREAGYVEPRAPAPQATPAVGMGNVVYNDRRPFMDDGLGEYERAYRSIPAQGQVAPRPNLPPELQGDQFSEVAGHVGGSPTREETPAAAAATNTARQVMADRGATRGSNFPAYGADAPNAPRPLAPERPQQQGFFSGLFRDPYAGKSAQDLYTQAQDMQRGGDEYGSNLLIQRAMQMQRAMPEKKEEGMRRGGTAGGGMSGKDAALHKALEIIHHMLSRR
jgi:hypothetical protein